MGSQIFIFFILLLFSKWAQGFDIYSKGHTDTQRQPKALSKFSMLQESLESITALCFVCPLPFIITLHAFNTYLFQRLSIVK